MTNKEIIGRIVIAIGYLDDFIDESEHTRLSQKNIIKVLNVMRLDIELEGVVRERLLRGYKDICTTTAIYFEEASYANSIFDVKEALEEMYPRMIELDLLRLDYGKGDPI